MRGPRLSNINCAYCSKNFKPRSAKTKYCSTECQRKARSKPLADTKICPHCGMEKSISDFHKSGKRLQGWCKSCQAARPRSHRVDVTCSHCGTESSIKRSSNKVQSWTCASCARLLIKEKNGGYHPSYKGSKFISGRIISQWKYSADKRGHEWNVTKEDLDTQFLRQGGICALSGLQMVTSKGSPYRPSLDRIDSNKGYTPDNIQFVCSVVNIMKNKLEESFFINLCTSISQHKSSVNYKQSQSDPLVE